MPLHSHCKICNKAVHKNHKAVKCDHQKFWVHIKCKKINFQTYNLFQQDETAWYCLPRLKEIFPFSKLNKTEFHATIQE